MKATDLAKNKGVAMDVSDSCFSSRFRRLFRLLGQQVGVVVLCAVLAVLISSCSDNKGRLTERKPQASDTLYTAQAAMNIYAYEPERALTIIDSALLLGNVEQDKAKLLKAKIFSQSLEENRLDTAQVILLGLLGSEFADDKIMIEEVLDLLLDIARKRQQYELQLQWGVWKVDCCRDLGRETEELRTEAELAFALAQLGEEEKALYKLNGIIAKLDGHRNIDKMDACIIALKRKYIILNQIGRMDEAISTACHAKEILNDYREHYAEYTDDSYRMSPTEEVTLRYCDFYTAQVNSSIANSYATLGKTDSARLYLALYERSKYFHSYSGRKYIVPTYRLLGDYDKMDEIYDEMVQKMGSDTLNREYADLLLGRAEKAEAQRNYQLASSYLHRYEQVKQQLNERLLRSKAFEYATKYQLQEERMKAETEQRRAKNSLYMLIVGFALLLIAIGIIVWMGILYRNIRRKNRVLAEQISEAVHYKNEVQNLNAEAEVTGTPEASETPVPDSETVVSTSLKSEVCNFKPENLDELSDEQLFKFLSEVIRRERLFTSPVFGRQTLTDRFNLSDRRVGAAFARGSEHNSLPDYVRSLRLEYACRLLSEHNEMTVSDVAAASGFSSIAVFSREFKRKYDLSPTFYRQQINEESL